MKKPLSDFFVDHPVPIDRRAILLGKGPSLDGFAGSGRRDIPIFGLNHAAQECRCMVAVYVDGNGRRLTWEFPADTIVIHYDKWTHQGDNDVYVYLRKMAAYQPDDPRHLNARGRTIEQLGGSAAVALTVLGMWGIREVLMVGFDGMDGDERQARLFPPGTPGLNTRGKSYATRVNPNILKALEVFDVTATWFHRGERWATTQRQAI